MDFELNTFSEDFIHLPFILWQLLYFYTELLYRAPELLRAGPPSLVPGTQKGDSYSFGIVLYEIHTRRGPFGETGFTPMECLRRVLQIPATGCPYRLIFV